MFGVMACKAGLIGFVLGMVGYLLVLFGFKELRDMCLKLNRLAIPLALADG
jgi:hypothetical protein|nr:MAG TPA: hypothetical protein [Caudoviricetes sp.]